MFTPYTPPLSRRRKGYVLLLAVIALGILVSLSLAASYVSMQEVRKASNFTRDTQALWNAQSGLAFMAYTLQNIEPARASDPLGQMQNIATAITDRVNCTVTYDRQQLEISSFGCDEGGSFRCLLVRDPADDELYTLYALGTCDDAPCVVNVKCTIQGVTMFDYGAFGDAGVELDSGAVTDSYDSASGPYAGQATNTHDTFTYANTRGGVGSNHDILVGGGAAVFGDATPGPAGSITNNGYVDGSTANADELMVMEPIEVPTPDWCHGTLNHSGDLAIGPGVHHYDSFYVERGEITITGPASLIADSFELDASVQLVIDDSNGPVDIYGTGYFNLDRETDLGNPDAPHNLRIWITTDSNEAPVIVDAEANTYGTIYAPNADLNLDASGGIYGAVIGRSIYMDRGFNLHYDEDLINHTDTMEFLFNNTGYGELHSNEAIFQVFGSGAS